eukprot:jgi/Chrpa1/2091/Chrysochromulina_OHIO_Genome00013735-RA
MASGSSADSPGGDSRSARVAGRAPVNARGVPLGAISFLMPSPTGLAGRGAPTDAELAPGIIGGIACL